MAKYLRCGSFNKNSKYIFILIFCKILTNSFFGMNSTMYAASNISRMIAGVENSALRISLTYTILMIHKEAIINPLN